MAQDSDPTTQPNAADDTSATRRIDPVPENDATSPEENPARSTSDTDTGALSGLAGLFGSRDGGEDGGPKRRWGRSTDTGDAPSVVVGRPRLPRLNTQRVNGLDTRIFAAIIGGCVGLLLALTTLGMLRSCEAIRGVASCGGSGGFVLQVVLLIAAIYLGALGLSAFKMPDPITTSFLAMGTLSVLAMMFFLGSITSAWMFLVIPVLSAGCYAFWHWLTAYVIEPAKSNPPG